jgi:hypothetical protein
LSCTWIGEEMVEVSRYGVKRAKRAFTISKARNAHKQGGVSAANAIGDTVQKAGKRCRQTVDGRWQMVDGKW